MAARNPRLPKTRKVRPSWHDSLPFSRSLMKRSPVPDTNARSACFIPKCFLRSRMSCPSAFDVMAFKLTGFVGFSTRYYRSVKYIAIRGRFANLLPIGNNFGGEAQAGVVSGCGSVASELVLGSSRRSTLQGFARCRAGPVASQSKPTTWRRRGVRGCSGFG